MRPRAAARPVAADRQLPPQEARRGRRPRAREAGGLGLLLAAPGGASPALRRPSPRQAEGPRDRYRLTVPTSMRCCLGSVMLLRPRGGTGNLGGRSAPPRADIFHVYEDLLAQA